MTHYKTSLLRLLVPAAVGMATGLVSTLQAHLNPQVVALVSPLASYGYYALVGWFEKSHPAASKLLVCARPIAPASASDLTAASANKG